MLVLSRKEHEKIIIGGDVIVSIERISSDRVSIGVQAPPDIRIIRGELDGKPDSKPDTRNPREGNSDGQSESDGN